MAQFRLTWLLLTPSLLSGVILIAVLCLFVGMSVWGYISDSDFFDEFLFGPSGLVTVLLTAPDMSSLFNAAIFSNPITYNIVILAAAAIVGVLVFETLEVSRRVVRESSVLWYRLHSPREGIKAASQATMARIGVRIAAVLGWMVYVLIFMAILTPFCITLMQLGIGGIMAGSAWGWAFSVCSIGLFAACIHLHIVFVRLILLRPRIFGGVDIEMAILN